jgi:hypothetical protein
MPDPPYKKGKKDATRTAKSKSTDVVAAIHVAKQQASAKRKKPKKKSGHDAGSWL